MRSFCEFLLLISVSCSAVLCHPWIVFFFLMQKSHCTGTKKNTACGYFVVCVKALLLGDTIFEKRMMIHEMYLKHVFCTYVENVFFVIHLAIRHRSCPSRSSGRLLDQIIFEITFHTRSRPHLVEGGCETHKREKKNPAGCRLFLMQANRGCTQGGPAPPRPVTATMGGPLFPFPVFWRSTIVTGKSVDFYLFYFFTPCGTEGVSEKNPIRSTLLF